MEFNEDLLKSVGLDSLPEAQKPSFLAYAKEELEARVGAEMSKDLTYEQLHEFEQIMDDPEKSVAWIKQNRPDYKEVVEKTTEAFKQELIKNRDAILS